jgi:hypothetical protein
VRPDANFAHAQYNGSDAARGGVRVNNMTDLDNLIADNVREFELTELRRRELTAAEREKMLTETLGAKTQPQAGEKFAVGDAVAGVTPKSIWYQFRRVPFAAVVSVAVGEIRKGEQFEYCVDVNCTVHRSYRIRLATVPETDNFLTALSQFMSFKIVPTIEEQMREQRRAEELAAANEADAAVRQRRMEYLARRQNHLLATLIQVECAPRVSFGVIY